MDFEEDYYGGGGANDDAEDFNFCEEGASSLENSLASQIGTDGDCRELLPSDTSLNKNATASALDLEDYSLPPVQVKNLIAGFSTECDLDLRLITIGARNVEYNPKKQNAAIVRLQAPARATCMVFPGGRVSITGVRTPQEAKRVGKIVAKLCRKSGHPDVKFKNFKIESLVCSAACGFPVRLENLAQDHSRFATYEPEIFCGLVYRYQISAAVKASILVFVSGKIIITGCKKPSDADEVFKNIYAVLYQYRA